MTDLIDTAQAASLAGVLPGTLRTYAADGRAPKPRRFGRSLMWDRAEIEAWAANRPGQGARTDLR